ncbi:hypothetical protein ACVBEH_16775 [Roseateles sp. GG27B]
MHPSIFCASFVIAASVGLLSPLTAVADASARAYLGDERIPGQVQPPLVHGSLNATSQAGVVTDAGYAYAFADLNTGILRVIGKSVYAPPYATTTDATAVITDTVTFSGGAGTTAFWLYAVPSGT